MEEERSESEPANPMGAFFDALTAYAVDPATWPELLDQFDHLSDRMEEWDPSTLVAGLSKAESLSWRIRDDTDPGQPGFHYLLLNRRQRVVGGAWQPVSLDGYLTVNRRGRLTFADPASKASFDTARASLGNGGGVSLISLSDPEKSRCRFGFLIDRSGIPPALREAAPTVTEAMFVSDDQGNERLEQVVQASLSLTGSELQVAMKLAHGFTLGEIADDVGISINTARNHLQSVFAKNGISRQSDLLLIITQLSVILAATDPRPLPKSPVSVRHPARHFIILGDGRRLAYRTYGSNDAQPILYLHETLGCSRLPPGTDDLAREFGLFLIAPDRPGFGFSDIDADFSFESVVDDSIGLLNHLHIETVGLLGFLSGGAYALCLADRFPERVSRLMLVAARPPQPMRGRFRHLMPLYERMIAQPWILTSFLNILRNRASEQTNARLLRSIYGAVDHDARLLDERADILDHMIAYTLESVTVTAAGVASELKCFARTESYALGRLESPVIVWHGTEDRLSDIRILEDYLHDQPALWRRFPRAGSLLIYEHWPDVLETLSNPRQPTNGSAAGGAHGDGENRKEPD